MSGLLFAEINIMIALIAVLVDRIFGYPNWIYGLVRHPVVWTGWVIGRAEAYLNRNDISPMSSRLRGFIPLLLLMVIVAFITVPLSSWLRTFELGGLIEAVLAASLLAQKSLLKHVSAVAKGLSQSLAQGRSAVRHIVGRDPNSLDESGVARGAIESLAENASDGVIAPLFWLLVAGLPGIAIYKAINTADSMIGYRNERYKYFGTAAARLDDLLNLPAARLTGLLLVFVSTLKEFSAVTRSWKMMRRDAGKHVSPNAGWPEAAMAGALNIRLGGPRSYLAKELDLPWLGDGETEIGAEDIYRAIALMTTAFNLVTAILFAAAMIIFLVN